MSLFTAIITDIQQKIQARTAYKETVISCIQEVVGVSITPEEIVSLKESVLMVRTKPIVKMAILLKKESICAKLNKRGLAVTVIK